MKLWLVGMMGSGKSEVGRVAAMRLGVAFVDTDEDVMEALGQSVAEIWEAAGEESFREAEITAIERVAASATPTLVATGGGAVLRRSNRSLMRQSGRVLWLQAPTSVLATRLSDAVDRPLLAGAGTLESRLDRVLEGRRDLYGEVADEVIDSTVADVVGVAALVEETWNRFLSA